MQRVEFIERPTESTKNPGKPGFMLIGHILSDSAEDRVTPPPIVQPAPP